MSHFSFRLRPPQHWNAARRGYQRIVTRTSRSNRSKQDGNRRGGAGAGNKQFEAIGGCGLGSGEGRQRKLRAEDIAGIPAADFRDTELAHRAEFTSRCRTASCSRFVCNAFPSHRKASKLTRSSNGLLRYRYLNVEQRDRIGLQPRRKG